MRRTLVHVAFALTSLVGAAAACSDTSGPATPGVYTLRSVYGQPLPLTLHATTEGDTVQLVGETVVLESGGLATVTKFNRTVVAGGPASYSHSDASWAYSVVGVRISLRPACPPIGDLCAIGRSGVVSDAELRLFEPGDPVDHAWVYDRTTIAYEAR